MIPQNLPNLLSSSAQKYPKHTAIVFGSKKITYQGLDELTSQIAAGLIHSGIKKEDKVALLLDNCPEFVIAYYAVLKAGAVALPINYMFKMEEAKFILEDSAAACVITSRAFVETVEELRLRIDTLKFIITTSKAKDDIPDFTEIRATDTSVLKNIAIHPQELAVLLYTSGTTGHPKGAMLSHHNLVSNALDSANIIRVNSKDAFICILPLFHSFAATVCMNLPLYVGAKIVIMKSLKPFKRIIRNIVKNRVSVFVAIPSIYNILKGLKLPKIADTPLIKLFNPVRICISGAAALPAKTFQAFERRFRIPLLEGYGLTEASPVVTLNPLKGPRIAGSIGKSISKNIELKIVNDRDEVLPADKIGELLVKGPNVMQGYYCQPQANQETLKNGWLYTGDMAKFDAAGYVYIVGRKKEMINVRGLNVYPREIEEALYQNPKVKEAAVIGINDAHKGEVPKGFVVLKEGEEAGEHEMIQYLRGHLASYKIPKYIEFKESLPKNSTGKILKRLLV
ncbi:MAG: long-chain fatty acid--CoA ligase [Candidatus Omnitrophica bacterium]|nr:long-chain fatty acid--CoA ligase [Candidatus Omnitrophota bacterium]MDD5237023.1 long-chain fatty acid--CoA ligase [Candidatus Omnitrophota bacterium]MDD5611308.1 long-chain fatty acid--CoA ligase [Candidatus Omnitrophota bacterium]